MTTEQHLQEFLDREFPQQYDRMTAESRIRRGIKRDPEAVKHNASWWEIMDKGTPR